MPKGSGTFASPGTASILHVEEPPDGEVPLRAAVLGQAAHVRWRHGQQGVALLKVGSGGLGLSDRAAPVLGGGAPAAGGVGALGRRAAVRATAELGVLAGAALLEVGVKGQDEGHIERSDCLRLSRSVNVRVKEDFCFLAVAALPEVKFKGQDEGQIKRSKLRASICETFKICYRKSYG